LGLLALIPCSAFGAAATSQTAAVVRVREISLTVADLAASERFFVSALGFHREGAVRELSGSDFEGLTGLGGARATSLHLALDREQIELVAYSRPRGRPAPEDTHSNDLWFQHLAIVTSDIERTQRQVLAAGARAISRAPQTLPASNPAAGGIAAFYFQGPSAHPLELIWFPSGKGQPRWQSASAPVLGIDHTAIAVSNSELARTFYADLLGLNVVGHSFNFGAEQEALSGVPGARVRITGLRAADGPGVEFLEYEAPRGGRAAPADGGASELWHCEISLVVRGLDALVQRMRQSKVRFVSDRIHSTHGLGFGGERGVIVLDPDGHAVRLVE
jgi:catechol 2,3-dioxygenase-like lactoylglutathione lyase family enzyme